METCSCLQPTGGVRLATVREHHLAQRSSSHGALARRKRWKATASQARTQTAYTPPVTQIRGLGSGKYWPTNPRPSTSRSNPRKCASSPKTPTIVLKSPWTENCYPDFHLRSQAVRRLLAAGSCMFPCRPDYFCILISFRSRIFRTPFACALH